MSHDDLVDLDKLADFENKIYAMAKEEFGTDDCLTQKVSVICVDRSRNQPLHYFQVPYSHKAKTEEEKDIILDRLLSNLSIATEAMENYLKIKRFNASFNEKAKK